MLKDPRLRFTDRFALLESRDLVARAFEEIHSRKISAGKANEIVAHVSQAKAYFAAALEAEELVRPLLQYYGVLGTTRALILLSSLQLRESGLAQRHGLNAVGWKEHFAAGGSWLDAKVRIEEGTFSQLAEVTSNTKIVEFSQSGRADLQVRVVGTASYPSKTEFCVGDLIARLPKLADLFEAIVQTPVSVWWCRIHHYEKYFQVEVSANRLRLPDVEEIRKLFEIPIDVVVKQEQVMMVGCGPIDQHTFSVTGSAGEFARHLKNVASDGAYQYLVLPLSSDIVLSQLSIWFAAAYSLGMLVRYFPTFWMSLIHRGAGDEILPLIRGISRGMQEFPSTATSHL